jgi:hypothetical protein
MPVSGNFYRPCRRSTVVRCLLLAMTLSLLGGCGGGGAELKSDIQTTTKGQQLLDLKKAYDAGAISREEYDRLRKQIVE